MKNLIAFFRFSIELYARFLNDVCNILLVTNIFNPSSSEFFNSNLIYLKQFIKHYKYLKIDNIVLPSEFVCAIILCLNENYENVDFSIIFNILNKVHNAFPETLKIISILMTLPVTTATNEPFFSS